MNPAFTPTKLRIVHLEDEARDRELVAATLARGGIDCEIVPARNKAEFQAAMLALNLDLILCDYSVPAYSGTEALGTAQKLQPEVPFIFVSGTIGEERAVESLQSGATDYVLKEHLGRLVPAIHRALHQAETERKQRQAEDAMRASEHKYRQVFEHLGDAAFLISVDTGVIIDTNPQAEALLGRSRGEILGWSERQLYPAEGGKAPDSRPVACACETRGGCEALVRRPDGTEVPVHVCASRLELHGRRLFLALFRDLTERKQLERQFLRAQRLESIGTLASGVAHYLNNILTPILMAGSMLSSEVKSATGQTLLKTLEDCAQRGAEVVHQLTTFAKGVEGKKGPVQPRHLLRELSAIVSRMFPKSIRLTCQAADDLWTVMAMPTQIHQVLLNLAVNARDAMPQGGELSLAAENVHLDEAAARVMPGAKVGPYVRLRIADTGLGIDPGIADRIFDPFFTTKGPEQGTGLGLSTALGIVKSHGGFIEFTSHPGQGTEFRIYLPACPVGTAASAAAAPPAPPRGRGEMILIVDDEKALCSVMQRTLETYGYRTLAAYDGAQAVALYSQRGSEISLVITDLDMPTLDGAAAAAALLSINPDVKIMVVTGLGSYPASGMAVAGCRAVIRKPCQTRLLLQTINLVLQGKRPLSKQTL